MPRAPRIASSRVRFGRARLAALACVGLVMAAVASAAACNGDAVGIDACRSIEQKRCELAPTCAGKDGVPKIKTATEIENCKDLYRDHCLVGLENTTKEPSKDQVDGCTAALDATANCQKQMVGTMALCMNVSVDADGAGMSPCAVFEHPEHLTACAFIVAPPTQTTSSSAASSSSTGTGGAGGSGG